MNTKAMHTHELTITWGTSRGRDTYGYTTAILRENGEVKAKTCGGGYDMRGTVFADWLEKTYQHDLRKKLRHKTHYLASKGEGFKAREGRNNFYGSTLNTETGGVTLDGGCGFDSIRRVAGAIGLEIRAIDASKKLDVIIVRNRRAI